MASSLRRRPVRWGLLAAAVTFAISTGLVMPESASANSYVWKKNGDGNWKDADNWNCILADSRACNSNPRYPNGVDDGAYFIGVYSNFVNVKVDGEVRVYRVEFGDTNGSVQRGVTIHIADNNGDDRLVIGRSTLYPDPPTIVRTGPVEDLDRFNIPILIVDPLPAQNHGLWIGTFPDRHFQFDRGINGGPGVNVNGLGVVHYRRSTAYEGHTVVRSGTLLLEPSDGLPALRPGNTLYVGDGTLDGNGVRTKVENRGPLDLTFLVTLPDGEFLSSGAVGLIDLAIDGNNIATGIVAMTGDAVLFYSSLILDGGTLQLAGNSRVTLSNAESGNTVVRRNGGRIARLGPNAIMDLGTRGREFKVDANATLTIDDLPLTGSGGVVKRGPGAMVFTGLAANTYTGLTVVEEGELGLDRTAATIVGRLDIGPANVPAVVRQGAPGSLKPSALNIAGNAAVLRIGFPTTIPAVGISLGRLILTSAAAQFTTPSLALSGATVSLEAGELHLTGAVHESNSINIPRSSVIEGGAASSGRIILGGNVQVSTATGPRPIPLRIDVPIAGQAGATLQKRGTSGVLLTKANPFNGVTTIVGGSLLVNGSLPGVVALTNTAVLGGTGSVGLVIDESAGGTIAPGLSPGRLVTSGLGLGNATTLAFELAGLTPGTQHDQLDVRGLVNLGTRATLSLTTVDGFVPTSSARFTLIANDGVDPVGGTFAGLAEGASVTLGGRDFTLSYRGGDGNDVVLGPRPRDPEDTPEVTYFLSEGATGAFFDEDILIANPNPETAPVTLTFSTETGAQVIATRSLPPQSRVTVHVDEIPGLEGTAASAQITSDAKLPLIVERSQFWNDASTYAGSTGSAVEQPEREWFFAEGSQGFFDTFVLVINPNAAPAEVTFTFFRESEPPVVKKVTLAEKTRLTLYAGDVPELMHRSFGIAVQASAPIMAERSMYFGTTPTRQWSGGTVSAGVTSPSTRWFLAEGATGSFFDTFILLSNPQSTPATVSLQYLLDTGETVTVPKTIPAGARLTTNIEAEDDRRLHNAAVSTVVTSDVPIIAERSMFWLGAARPWGEAHNSFGVVEAGTRWGLSEGRTGGPLQFHTFILLANPQSTDAAVRVTFLRETGAPVVQTYRVPATSRFNIDANGIDGLQEAAFGAVIEVTNDVAIVVERSIYWTSSGFQFSGGTNATGIRLAPVAPSAPASPSAAGATASGS